MSRGLIYTLDKAGTINNGINGADVMVMTFNKDSSQRGFAKSLQSYCLVCTEGVAVV